MLSIISLILTAVGYCLFIFTEAVVFPVIMIFVSAGIGLAVLIPQYKSEKLVFSDFVKETFGSNYGSLIAVIGAIFFLVLLIF